MAPFAYILGHYGYAANFRCCWLIESDSSAFFLFNQVRFFFKCSQPLAVLCVAFTADLPTSVVITSMRGARAGVNPPRQSPPCICLFIFYLQTTLRHGMAGMARAPVYTKSKNCVLALAFCNDFMIFACTHVLLTINGDTVPVRLHQTAVWAYVYGWNLVFALLARTLLLAVLPENT